MRYLTPVATLDFPSPITGDVYTTDLMEETIRNHRSRLDNRTITGGFYENVQFLKNALNPPDLQDSETDIVYAKIVGSMKNNTLKESMLEIAKENKARANFFYKSLLYHRAKVNSMSHAVIDLYIDNDCVFAELEILRTNKGLELEAILHSHDLEVSKGGLTKGLVKFLPTLNIGEKRNGVVKSILEIVSIDAYMRNTE